MMRNRKTVLSLTVMALATAACRTAETVPPAAEHEAPEWSRDDAM